MQRNYPLLGIQLGLITLGSILLLKLAFQSVVMVRFFGLAVLYDKSALCLYTLLGFRFVRMLVVKEGGKESSWADKDRNLNVSFATI